MNHMSAAETRTENTEEVRIFESDAEIEGLVRDFEACTLPRSEWTHNAHLVVALWCLSIHPGREASIHIRNGIRRYNAASGIRTTRARLSWVDPDLRRLD